MEHIQNIDVELPTQEPSTVIRLPIPRGQANAKALLNACYEAIVRLPGVQSAALTSSQPLTGASGPRAVSPNYFQTLGIALKRGRFFTRADHHRIVINEALARRDYPTEDPIGRVITIEGEQLEIVGVAADTRSPASSEKGTPDRLSLDRRRASRPNRHPHRRRPRLPSPRRPPDRRPTRRHRRRSQHHGGFHQERFLATRTDRDPDHSLRRASLPAGHRGIVWSHLLRRNPPPQGNRNPCGAGRAAKT